MKDFVDPVAIAAHNLLVHCANLRRGQQVLIVVEQGQDTVYDPMLGQVLAEAAQAMGVKASLWPVAFTETVTSLDPDLIAQMAASTCTIFFARLGDQIRFLDHAKGHRAIVCYTLDMAMFTSAYGRAHYTAFTALKAALDLMLSQARQIRVTCPLGTDFTGPGHWAVADPGQDVTVTRFPMAVFAPVPMEGFCGRLAQAGFLTGTCSRFYQPYAAPLEGVLQVAFHHNRITGFDGSAHDVAKAQAHYAFVAQQFGIDKTFIHSWHAGIHPGCAYLQPAAQNYARWCSGAFGNPRILHVHSCGAYAPGEISINIIDPTVVVDGITLWEKGVFRPDHVPGGEDILAQYPCARHTFDHPAQAIGL